MAVLPLKLCGRSRWRNEKERDQRFLTTSKGNVQERYNRKTLAV